MHPCTMSHLTVDTNTKIVNFHKRKVQGYALLFQNKSIFDVKGIKLSVKKVVNRHMQPKDCIGCYLQNTNLHHLPPNCIGVLVAFQCSLIKLSNASWNLTLPSS